MSDPLPLGAVLAHEYGHAYLFMRRFPSLPLVTEEGLCELFAWLWLGGGDGGSGSGGSSGTTINGGGKSNPAVYSIRQFARTQLKKRVLRGLRTRDLYG